MAKHILSGATALCWLVPATALAQTPAAAPASETAPAPAAADPFPETTPPSEPATADTSASVSATNTSVTASSDANGELPYMKRYKPEAGVWEVGLFSGLFLPSGGVGLYSPRMSYVGYDGAAWSLGGRLAYFPLKFLGFEGEFFLADGSAKTDLQSVDPSLRSQRANFFAYRGHVIAQLPIWSIVPFVVVGGGAIGVNSQPLGRDTDAFFHFGGGVKVPLTRDFSLRVDFRENMGPRANANYGGISFNEEVNLGGTFTFGRADKSAPPPDRDHDAVPDDRDACPDTAALTPDGCPGDGDGDGVKDPDDYCPREAGTGPNGCPDPDADKDGVPAPCDLCPTEAGNAPDGCPVQAPVDKDGDGINDDVDKCPNEPETKNGYEDEDGCPDEIPEEVKKYTGSIDGIQFVQGSSTITKGSTATLKAASDILKKYPSLHIEISGHTSSEGTAEINQKLSDARANAVRDWLVKDGVDEGHITARGAGPSEPIADNKTAAGRAKNRRIEFNIIKQ